MLRITNYSSNQIIEVTLFLILTLKILHLTCNLGGVGGAMMSMESRKERGKLKDTFLGTYVQN